MQIIVVLSYHTGLSVVGQLADKGKSGASTADSAIGTSTRQSIVTGGTFVGGSQFSEVRYLFVKTLCCTGWSTTCGYGYEVPWGGEGSSPPPPPRPLFR